MKIKAVIATTKSVDTLRGREQFSPEALAKLAASAKGRPILHNFDMDRLLGRITRAWIENGQLCIEGEINTKLSAKDRLVPGYATRGIMEKGGEGSTIFDAKLFSCGLTTTPYETDLPEIEEI